MKKLETERLYLRPFTEDDIDAFTDMNMDEVVMEFYPSTYSKKQSMQLIRQMKDSYKKDGFCFHAVFLKSSDQFIGMVGLNVPNFEAHFTPCVEIGWRLVRKFWGQGYAFEASKRILQYAFEELKLNEVVAFSAKTNMNSQRLMRKLNMTHNPDDDFAHPGLASNHKLSEHVLYRLTKDQYLKNK